jgi:hypothetical protein
LFNAQFGAGMQAKADRRLVRGERRMVAPPQVAPGGAGKRLGPLIRPWSKATSVQVRSTPPANRVCCTRNAMEHRPTRTEPAMLEPSYATDLLQRQEQRMLPPFRAPPARWCRWWPR